MSEPKVTCKIECPKCGANEWRGPKYRRLADTSTHGTLASCLDELQFTCEYCGYVERMTCLDSAHVAERTGESVV